MSSAKAQRAKAQRMRNKLSKKRKVRTVVLGDDGSIAQFEYLEDGMKHAACELDNLPEVLDDRCTVWLVCTDDEPSDEAAQGFVENPLEHRRGLTMSRLAIIETAPSRDPILAIDVEGMIVLVVGPAAQLEKYLFGRYRQRVPLDPPPAEIEARWVVSISRSEELRRIQVHMGMLPGIARA